MDTMTDGQVSGSDASRNLTILYIDDYILAVNKPAGLPTLPDGYNPNTPHLKSILEPQYGRLWIVHRLDRDTSGVVLLARTPEAHRALNTQFETRQVTKLYHALVCTVPEWEEKTVRLPLRPNGDRRHRTVVSIKGGKTAVTKLHRLESLGRYALIEALPHTGRTHQIRAHLAAIDLPILGDALYGGQPALYLSMLKMGFSSQEAETPLIQRCALHACSLDFMHPVLNESFHLEAPYSQDIDGALLPLRHYSSQNPP